jgi:L-fuculose-phosphate aldolase
MAPKEEKLKSEIIRIGKKLYQAGLAVAKSGNLSARVDADNILITATQTSLAELKEDDIVCLNLASGKKESGKGSGSGKDPSSELPLHSLIHKSFSAKTVIHCHPPLINGYFTACPDIKVLTFETKLYLGDVPVVEQDTPAVTKPELVIEALKKNNLAVLKNHGVVSVADNLEEALHLVELLEEAVKTAAIARLFRKQTPDEAEAALKENLVGDDSVSADSAYPMFSREHIQAIVDLVNKDEFIAQKGQELDLTVKLAIKLDGSDKEYKFNFEKGKIKRLDFDAEAPFVISADSKVWEAVFLGKIDPFVATTQGRMKLQGQLGQLSRWYVPFSRLFELFKEVKIK